MELRARRPKGFDWERSDSHREYYKHKPSGLIVESRIEFKDGRGAEWVLSMSKVNCVLVTDEDVTTARFGFGMKFTEELPSEYGYDRRLAMAVKEEYAD